jgi:hypothetical protein
MYSQTLIPTEDSLVVAVPKELVGHRLKVTIDDLGDAGLVKTGETPRSLDEILAAFSAVKLDTLGFKFDREEANSR